MVRDRVDRAIPVPPDPRRSDIKPELMHHLEPQAASLLGVSFGLLNISKQIAIVFPDVADAGHNDRKPRHSQTDHGRGCCHKRMAALKKSALM